MKKTSMAAMAAMAALAASSPVLAGCSGDPAPPAPAGSSAPASSAPPSAQPSAESTTTATARDCLDGRYRITSFEAVGTDQSTANGKGGDLTLSFDDGAFALQSKGKDPVAITAGGATGQLVLDGKITGSYQAAGADKVTFTLGKSTGKAKLRSPNGKQESVKVAQVAQVLVPSGEATATCKGDGLTLKTERLTLDLQK